MITVLGLVLTFLSVPCYAIILVHAFHRSVGTGFMVLCLPLYCLYYGFSQFEHRQKGLVLAGWLGCLVVGVTLRVLGASLAAQS